MKYELVLMLKPSLSEDQAKKSIESVKEHVKTLSGKVEKEDFWGKRKLAYEINRMQEATYTFLNLELDPSQLKKLTSKISMNSDVVRHLVLGS